MKTSTRIIGIGGAVLVLLALVTHDWWGLAVGGEIEISALLWAIYEKLEDFLPTNSNR